MKFIFSIAVLLLPLWGALMGMSLVYDTSSLKEYSFEELSKLPRQNLVTETEKKGKVNKHEWEGFRFDQWLKNSGYRDFHQIRIESEDRYMVTLSKYEFEQNPSWMVFVQDGEVLDADSFRIIFPSLRQMYWVTGINRVVLENSDPLGIPKSFMVLQQLISQHQLHKEPKPFVGISGYSVNEIIKGLKLKEAKVIFYSNDGLRLRVDFPKHLTDAILELREDGSLNLKSPQIPGGMWINDIAYMQIEEKAWVAVGGLGNIVKLNKELGWNLEAPVMVRYKSGSKHLSADFADLISDPQLFEKSGFFEIILKK